MPAKGLVRTKELTPEERVIVEEAARIDKGFAKSVGAIALGAYTDITDIIYPLSATPGDLVNVTVIVRNLADFGFYIAVGARYDNTELRFTPEYAGVDPGATYSFTSSFIMPDKDVQVSIWSFFWTGEEWYQDDLETIDIALGTPLAEIKEIWYWDPNIGYYNSALTEPPTMLIGSEAGAQFILENLSDVYLDLGLFISAFDPLGNSVGASITGPGHLPPGGSIGGHYRVVTDRPGTYTFTVDIITSSMLPYGIIGTLENVPVARVVGEIPPLAGHVYSPFVVDSTTGETFYSAALPVEIDGGHKVIVGIRWMNDGGETATLTSTFELVDPDGIQREAQTFTTVLSPSEGTGGQTGVSVELDKVGMWKIHAILEADGTLVDEETWDAISVAVPPPPEYAGSITGKWINKVPEGSRIPIPAEVAADNNTFEVGIRYKNISGMTVPNCGPKVQVWDPDGVLRASPAVDLTGMSHNEELETQYNICAVDKPGNWTIRIDFLMDSTEVVATYAGPLFTATSVVEEYVGSITGKWINKVPEGSRIPIPAEVAADNNTFEVGIRYRNYSGRTVPYCGCKVKVWDPDGIVRASPAVDWTGMSHNEELETQYNICPVDKEGNWNIHVDFLMASTEVVASYAGLLFTAVEEVLPPEYTLVQHTIYSYAYVYDGEVEVTTADFRISPFTGSAWAANQFAAELESEVKAAGARVIEVKAYADVSPLLWTDIRVEVTATPITTTSSKATGFAWAAIVPIIIKALAWIAVIVVLTLAIKSVLRSFQSKPINEEIKLAMTKETLVSLAVDLEVKLELTPTPVDVLEGKTKGELIIYVDSLAEEIVPPGLEIPWTWIAIGAVGILGVAALTMGRKR